jgi:hypothetical protein
MLSEVFESLRGFSSHDFVLYGFTISDDNEVMRSLLCKPFHSCQKLSTCLNILKKKILCGLKDNKDSQKKNHRPKNLVEVHSPTQIYVQ